MGKEITKWPLYTSEVGRPTAMATGTFNTETNTENERQNVQRQPIRLPQIRIARKIENDVALIREGVN